MTKTFCDMCTRQVYFDKEALHALHLSQANPKNGENRTFFSCEVICPGCLAHLKSLIKGEIRSNV